MIQDISLEAYEVLQPNLGKLQNMIYNVLQIYPDSSNHDLSQITKKPINTVTPRVKELRDKGLVICSGYKIDNITHKRVMCWKTVC